MDRTRSGQGYSQSTDGTWAHSNPPAPVGGVEPVVSPDPAAGAVTPDTPGTRDDVLHYIGTCLARLQVRAERDAAGHGVSISNGFACDLQHALRAAEKFITEQEQADHIAHSSNMVPAPLVGVALGPIAFEFDTFQQWVNKAAGWFKGLALTNRNAARKRYLCIDAAGRVCMIGKDFRRARDEGTFPTRVYLIDAEQENAPPTDAHASPE